MRRDLEGLCSGGLLAGAVTSARSDEYGEIFRAAARVAISTAGWQNLEGVWPGGLQGCVFTQDINQAIYISDAMETGTVQINSAPARGPDHFPFQGFRDSGIGSQVLPLGLPCQNRASEREAYRQKGA